MIHQYYIYTFWLCPHLWYSNIHYVVATQLHFLACSEYNIICASCPKDLRNKKGKSGRICITHTSRSLHSASANRTTHCRIFTRSFDWSTVDSSCPRSWETLISPVKIMNNNKYGEYSYYGHSCVTFVIRQNTDTLINKQKTFSVLGFRVKHTFTSVICSIASVL